MTMHLENIEGMYRLAEEVSLGQHKEAALLFRQVAASVPAEEERIPFQLLAADEWLQAGLFEEAIADCRRALAINADSATAWRVFGRAFVYIGRDDDAIIALRKSLELSPSATTCIYLAGIYLRSCRFEEAEKLYCRALGLNPDFDEAYFNLGLTLRAQEKLDEAIDAFSAAARLSPEFGGAYREIGATLLTKGDPSSAGQYIRKSLELDPDDEASVELMKLCQVRNGRGQP